MRVREKDLHILIEVITMKEILREYTMKTLLILLCVMCSLTGCRHVLINENHEEEDIVKDIYITKTERCDIEWDKIQSPVNFDTKVIQEELKPIENSEIALEIATTIIDKLHENGIFTEYTLTSIIHSTEDGIWLFEYSINQKNTDVDDLVDCGCLYIAINGSDGVLIKVWVEE